VGFLVGIILFSGVFFENPMWVFMVVFFYNNPALK